MKSKRSPSPRPRTRGLGGLELAVLGLFFASGMSALVYEVVWSRSLTYVFGSSAYAVATVLAAYMAGLALGSTWFGRLIDRKGHPIRVYGLLEGGIAVWAILLPLLLGLMDHLYVILFRALEPGPYALSLIRFVCGFLLLLVPTTLMGGTLPVLGKILLRDWRGLGNRAGILYGINTFGAVCGVVLGGFVLVPFLGLSGATGVAVVINFGVLGVALLLARRYPYTLPEEEAPAKPAVESAPAAVDPDRRLRRAVLLVYAASGFAALSYEVAWFKVLALIVGTTTYAFSTMLTTFLLGLTLGAVLFGRIADRVGRSEVLLLLVQLGIPLAALGTAVAVPYLPQALVDGFASTGGKWLPLEILRFSMAAATMFIPTVLMGAAFPLVTRVYARRATLGRSLGTLYAANTVGAILGSFLTGFVLVPWVGRQDSILVATGVNVLAAIVLFLAIGWRSLPRPGRIAAAVLGLLLVPGWYLGSRTWDPRIMNAGAYYYAPAMAEMGGIEEYLDGWYLLYEEETTEALLSVWQTAHITHLRTSGKVDASSHGDMVTQKLIAHLPMLYHGGEAKETMVLGLASGISVGSLLSYPVESCDTVELIEGMDHAAHYFDYYNHDCLDDPRHHLYVNDGRNHLKLTDKKYDVIVSEPTNPYVAGVGSLFTREFYELARESLAPDGVVCVWVQVYHMREEELLAAIATFLDVFPFAHLWTGMSGDLILVGANEDKTIDLDRLRAAYAGPPGDDLRSIELAPTEALLGHFVTDRGGLEELVADTRRRVTDDNLLLEFTMPRYMFQEDLLLKPGSLSRVLRPARLALDPEDRADPGVQAMERHQAAHWVSLRTLTLALLPPGMTTAEEAYRAAYNAAPYELLTRERLGNTINQRAIQALQEGRFEDARRDFREGAIVGSPEERSLSWNNLGLIHFREGELDSARADWERSLALEPFSPTVNFNLSLVLAHQGEYAEAVQLLRVVQRLDPNDPTAMNNLAYHLALLKEDLEEAEHWSREAVAREPSSIHLDTLGWILALRERPEEAVDVLEEALELDPENHEARVHLGFAFQKLGRIEEARAAVREALEKGNPSVQATAASLLRELEATP